MNSKKSALELSIDEFIGILRFYNSDVQIQQDINDTIICDTNPLNLDYPEGYGVHTEAKYIYSPTKADAFKIEWPGCSLETV